MNIISDGVEAGVIRMEALSGQGSSTMVYAIRVCKLDSAMLEVSLTMATEHICTHSLQPELPMGPMALAVSFMRLDL